MPRQELLDHRGEPINLGYGAARPSWRKNEDSLDRSSIALTEEKVLGQSSRLELLSVLRDLERNNPVCKAITQVFVSNLGHCKIRSTTEDGEFNDQKEKVLNKYLKKMEITGQGISRVLGSIITDLLLAGEVFCILTKGGSVQLVPSERVASSREPGKRKANESDGIVLDRFGQVKAYRICQVSNGSVDFSQGSYIDAKNLIHIANKSRIGQIRGTPMLASAAQTLEDIHTVQAAYTAKVKTSSALTGFITSNQPYSARWDGNDFDGEPMRSTYTKLYNGSILLLEQGESVETIQGGNIDGVDKFLTQLIAFACSSVGITVENLVGWSNASFSSSKSTRAVTNHRFGILREFIEESFLRRLMTWKSYKATAAGELPEPPEAEHENFSFQWTTSPTLDRRQDAQTDALLLKENLASHTEIFANNGKDFEAEAERIEKDKALILSLQGKYRQEDAAGAIPSEERATAKEIIDAYGAGVRGGSITPQEDDENHFRNLLGLPVSTQPVQDAWEKDGGARRPITLKSQEGFEEQENIDEDEDEDEDEGTAPPEE